MKITVVGVGAIGGLLAARLAESGHEVSALARGATLAALRERGVRVEAGGAVRDVALAAASHEAARLGPADLVLIALKGPALADAAASLGPLVAPHTVIVPMMNGVPWWFLRFGPRPSDVPLASVDPSGAIDRALPLPQVLGAVVHMSCSTAGPAHVVHFMGDRLIVGEPAGGASERVARVADALAGAGFSVERSSDVRRDIWFKLWGNMTMNPVSALTGASCDRILDDPLVAAFMLRAMAEAAAIGARIGCPIEQSGEERMAVTRKLGAFKTSMLQDAEAGRPLELDALVSAVREIGTRVGVPTPEIDTLLGLARLMARGRGLYA